MIPQVTLRRALTDPELLGNALPGDSFLTWRTVLIGAMGEPLDDAERETFRAYTERDPPSERVKEAAFIVGRRGGKDRATAALCAYLATCCEWPSLTRGETGRIICIAPDQSQARIQRDYIAGALEGSPLLSRRIVNTTADTIELDNGIVIEVRSASFRRLRGITAVAVVASESAFWHSDETSANPDSEILGAIRPALLTTKGLLVQISTPYARKGELFEAYHRHFGTKGDGRTLVVQGPSIAFNPTLDAAEIERAYAEDPEAASAEYGGEFRNDLRAFVTRDVIMACVDEHVRERQPHAHAEYFAFVDPSGGSSDSFTMAIGHAEDDRVVVDCLREVVPPFSPESVVHEFCADLQRYRVTTVTGDRYAGEWPREQFRKRGVEYEPSELAASDLYRELLPRLNTRTIALLDHPRAIGQLCALERRDGRAKDIIDHSRGAVADVANAIAGVAWIAGDASARDGAMTSSFIWQNRRRRRTYGTH